MLASNLMILTTILNLFIFFYLCFLIIWFLNFIIQKVPLLSTSSRTVKTLLKIILKEKEGKKTFVDLGCGRGRILIAVKKEYPHIEIIGYENWPTQFLLAKIMFFLSQTKGKIFYKNLFQADLTNADIVFCYLYPRQMSILEKKFEKELKNGALVISGIFPLPNWEPTQTIALSGKNSSHSKIFLYKKSSI